MFFFIATSILANKRYVIEGNVENVAYSVSCSWPCYIAVYSPGNENNLKFHATRHMPVCQYAAAMKRVNQPVRLIGQKSAPGESHETILIMDAGASATFYVDVFGNVIHDDHKDKITPCPSD